MIDYDTSVKGTYTEVRKGLLDDEHSNRKELTFFKLISGCSYILIICFE